MEVKHKSENKMIFYNPNFNNEDVKKRFGDLNEMLMMYRCAIREISTKLEVINEEFQVKRRRNPIEYMKSRVKTPDSIFKKLERRGLEVSLESARENLNDIAGIRVVCSFVDDIYTLADMLIRQDDITLIEKKDYIKNPKKNGYRSLHLVLEVPVFFSDYIERMKVEVQIRTIAMDFWASLEHKLYYKKDLEGADLAIISQLKNCPDIIASTDTKMHDIRDQLDANAK